MAYMWVKNHVHESRGPEGPLSCGKVSFPIGAPYKVYTDGLGVNGNNISFEIPRVQFATDWYLVCSMGYHMYSMAGGC